MRLFRNDSTYAVLKEATLKEGAVRRIVAVVTGLGFMLTGFCAGLITGAAMLRGLHQGREAAWKLITTLEGNGSITELAWGMAFAIIGAHLAIHIWRWLMLKLKLASPALIKRVEKYGPY